MAGRHLLGHTEQATPVGAPRAPRLNPEQCYRHTASCRPDALPVFRLSVHPCFIGLFIRFQANPTDL